MRDMLREIRFVRQDDAHLRRRWFQDDYLDLFVWTDATGTAVAFQLAYDRARQERALSWSTADGFRHHRVDSGEASLFASRTPLLFQGGVCPIRMVARQFHHRSHEMEAKLRDFILVKLRHGQRLRRLRGHPSQTR